MGRASTVSFLHCSSLLPRWRPDRGEQPRALGRQSSLGGAARRLAASDRPAVLGIAKAVLSRLTSLKCRSSSRRFFTPINIAMIARGKGSRRFSRGSDVLGNVIAWASTGSRQVSETGAPSHAFRVLKAAQTEAGGTALDSLYGGPRPRRGDPALEDLERRAPSCCFRFGDDTRSVLDQAEDDAPFSSTPRTWRTAGDLVRRARSRKASRTFAHHPIMSSRVGGDVLSVRPVLGSRRRSLCWRRVASARGGCRGRGCRASSIARADAGAGVISADVRRKRERAEAVLAPSA